MAINDKKKVEHAHILDIYISILTYLHPNHLYCTKSPPYQPSHSHEPRESFGAYKYVDKNIVLTSTIFYGRIRS